jgi:hypothetical protein
MGVGQDGDERAGTASTRSSNSARREAARVQQSAGEMQETGASSKESVRPRVSVQRPAGQWEETAESSGRRNQSAGASARSADGHASQDAGPATPIASVHPEAGFGSPVGPALMAELEAAGRASSSRVAGSLSLSTGTPAPERAAPVIVSSSSDGQVGETHAANQIVQAASVAPSVLENGSHHPPSQALLEANGVAAMEGAAALDARRDRQGDQMSGRDAATPGAGLAQQDGDTVWHRWAGGAHAPRFLQPSTSLSSHDMQPDKKPCTSGWALHVLGCMLICLFHCPSH